MLRIQMMQNINVLLKNVKTVVLNDWKIRRLLLKIKIIYRISIKNIEKYNPERKPKVLIVIADMIVTRNIINY